MTGVPFDTPAISPDLYFAEILRTSTRHLRLVYWQCYVSGALMTQPYFSSI